MGKISLISAKYIIHAMIKIEGVVDKPDVIGAIFGQTEGLLGSELELRELQRSGRIGRIEVISSVSNGKTKGEITIPSSLDKSETAIVGASLEIIQRIGPCNAKINIDKIEDVRVSKRNYVVDRAKTLLRDLMENSMPDSQELADEVAQSVRVMEIQEYGKDRLPAGPGVKDSDEIIIVEGRADVVNLLKYGIKNSIAINGTSVPNTIKELSKQKVVTVFVDGDRGGDLIIKELLDVAEVDFVTKAPDGKELEELTKKEIHKCIRNKIAAEQVKLEFSERHDDERLRKRNFKSPNNNSNNSNNKYNKNKNRNDRNDRNDRNSRNDRNKRDQKPPRKLKLQDDEKEKLKKYKEDLIGTRGAYVLDRGLNILGKVPLMELEATLKSINNSYAIVLDGDATKSLVSTAERSGTKLIVPNGIKVNKEHCRAFIVTDNDLN